MTFHRSPATPHVILLVFLVSLEAGSLRHETVIGQALKDGDVLFLDIGTHDDVYR